MSNFPPYIKTRNVSAGGALGLETGNPLSVSISVKASRSLIWQATGFRYESTGVSAAAETAGSEIIIPLPVTDMAGWIDAKTGALIDVSDPESFSHSYTVSISVGGREVVKNKRFVLPEEDGSTIDLDMTVPVGSEAGDLINIPDTWTKLLQPGLHVVTVNADTTVQVENGHVYEITANESAAVTLDGLPGAQVAISWTGAAGTVDGQAVTDGSTWVAVLLTSGWALYEVGGSAPPVDPPVDLDPPTVSVSGATETTFALSYSTTATGVTGWQYFIDGGTWTALSGTSPDTITVDAGQSGQVEVRYSVDGGASWSPSASAMFVTIDPSAWGTLYADDFSQQALSPGEARRTTIGDAPWWAWSTLTRVSGWQPGNALPPLELANPAPVYEFTGALTGLPQNRWEVSMDFISRITGLTELFVHFGTGAPVYSGTAPASPLRGFVGWRVGFDLSRTIKLWKIEADGDQIQVRTEIASGGVDLGNSWHPLQLSLDASNILRVISGPNTILEHDMGDYVPPAGAFLCIEKHRGSETSGSEIANLKIRVA